MDAFVRDQRLAGLDRIIVLAIGEIRHVMEETSPLGIERHELDSWPS